MTLEKIYEAINLNFNDGEDPWGFSFSKFKQTTTTFYPIYKKYFKTRVFGQNNIESKSYVIVSNHSGQIAIDAMLIMGAFLYDVAPPKILRPMIARFLPKLPFIGMWMSERGAVLGDRDNCIQLLKHGESILAFPEGVSGISKNTSEFYKLKNFSSGFFKMALKADVEILPVAVIGAEEFYPYVYHPKKLAKFLRLPALPLTPLFPLLGPLGAIPLPSPVDIHIGIPYKIPKLSPQSPDASMSEHIENIKNQIQNLIDKNLAKKRPLFQLKKS